MVARIHHTKNGTEYVLQYNSKTDTIESRENRLTLIGGVPNYFRDSGLEDRAGGTHFQNNAIQLATPHSVLRSP